jgi:hypothetical protein
MLTLLTWGCADAGQKPPPAKPGPERVTTDFDPATAGEIRGRVTWAGALPPVPPFEYRRNLPSGAPSESRLVRDNPNAPVIDPQTRGVTGAVVMLCGIDPRHARPWDLPPVRIELRDRRLHLIQGDGEYKTGFVRKGDSVEMVSREEVFNTLRASGAAFFSLTLPDLDRPRRRVLSENGIVELTSGAGYYWMRAYLFMDEHPYYVRTNIAGNYKLPGVPPGKYQVKCWMPNWNIARHERDPETTVISRIFYRPPVEQAHAVEVRPGTTVTMDFNRSAPEFESGP